MISEETLVIASLAKQSPSVGTGGLPRRSAPRDDGATVQAEVERMLAMGREIRAHMAEPVSSDLRDLYDENGLPARGGDFSLTDIEPALKD
jgi:hypothetical protein